MSKKSKTAKKFSAKKCRRCSLNCTVARNNATVGMDAKTKQEFLEKNFGKNPNYTPQTCPKA